MQQSTDNPSGHEYVFDIVRPLQNQSHASFSLAPSQLRINTNQTGTCIIRTKMHRYLNFLYTMADDRYIENLQYIIRGMQP
jgi:hypothetical protein